jgi:glycosyltransferase involved in cell wall biosynthesis
MSAIAFALIDDVHIGPGTLLVGNFLSGSGLNECLCEELARRLSGSRRVLTASSRRRRIARLVDMLLTVWRDRDGYEVAHVDVFSGHAFFWAEAVCWALRRVGKPYVLTLRGGNLPSFARRWPARVRGLLESAEVVTTPSPYLLSEMASYAGRLELLPNPLEVAAYPFRARRELQPRLVWLRAFDRYYNAPMAPEVLAHLLPDFPEADLVMYGPDKGDGSLQDTQASARSAGVSERLRFPGRVPKCEVPLRLAEGDIFLNTANVDNTPVSVLEAMACGLCVVSTNVCGIPYLLRHEEDALLVPPRDPQTMADAVRRLLRDPELALRLSVNARKRTEQFDWSNILPRWESVLARATSARKGSAQL